MHAVNFESTVDRTESILKTSPMHLNKYFNSVCCKEVYWTVEHATQAPKKLPSNETVSEPVKGMLSSSEFFFPKKSAPIGPWRIEHTFLGDGFRCVPFTH